MTKEPVKSKGNKEIAKDFIAAPSDNTTKGQETNDLEPNPSKYQAIRYNGIIETPPSEKPFQDCIPLLKEYF